MLKTRTRPRTVGLAFLLLVSMSMQSARAVQTFTLKQNHSGSNFLDNWTFSNGTDPDRNFGDILYQSQTQAQQEQLTFLNSAGNFIVKVDNTTSGVGDSNYGRASIRISTTYTITTGNLVLFDALHIPFGCSVWPAFWSRGQVWPDDGEIDIIEAVNLMPQNQINLHTLDGCTHPDNASSSSIETGQLVSTDCFNQTNNNQGCIVQVPGASFGESFAASGGGVYAFNWNTSGMYMWFFPRSSIPSDLPTDNPNPDGWGLPTAAYPTSSCDASKFFTPQNLILNIDICGSFAGDQSVFTSTGCSGLCTDLVQIPSNYDNAYFEISYIRVFEQEGASNSSGSSASGSATSSAGAQSTSSASPSSAVDGKDVIWRMVLLLMFGLCLMIV